MRDVEETIRLRLLEAERKAQELEKEAYERAYAQGQKDGFEYGQKSMEVVKKQLERILSGIEEGQQRVFQDYRQWFISNCLGVARQIIGRELEANPDFSIRLIESLLEEAQAHSSLTLYLHSKDIHVLQKHGDFQALSDKHSFALKADETLERGGCRIESDLQLFDASLETQIKNFRQASEIDS